MHKSSKATLKYFAMFVILGFVLATTGCGGRMALEKNMTKLDTSKESIALFTIRVSNQVKPKYQLPLSCINVKSNEGEESKHFGPGKDFKYEKKQYFEYLLSLALPPGENKIWLITGIIRGGSYGAYRFNTDIDFNLEPDSIVYLGHLEMVNRLRREGESQAARFASTDGSLLGLLLARISYEQAGMSDGTMELTISDRFDEDIKNFKQHYPVLENYTVKKNIIKLKEEESIGRTP
jgi:hypothetical protein